VERPVADLRGRPVKDLSDDELFCFAARVEESGDRDTALSLFEALMRREQRPGRAHFSVGRLLLENGDDAGIALIEQVTEALPKTIIPGCELIIRFLLASGRESEARPYIDRYRQCQEAELDAAGLRDRE
jgi:hypothetical protein